MKIGINGNEANVAHRVGVNQYAFEILRHWPEDDVTVYLSHPPLSDMPKLHYEVFGPLKMWTLTGLQKKLLLDPPDVLFTPTHYAPLLPTRPSVISIMDLAFEKFPAYFKTSDLCQLKYWTRVSVAQAAKIITISESTKRDICEIYKVPAEKIVVTYPGFDQKRFNSQAKPNKKYGDYFLYLGTLQPRKNLERLIEAYRQLKTRSKLVIAGMINEGRGGWMNENIRASQNIILTGYLPDEDLPGLYAGARAFVLPSLYEGFGIPAIEAMACGTPVVVSRVSSLPEICGEAAFYIDDPYSIESIQSALTKVDKSKAKLGLEWIKRYNWDNTVRQTLEVIKSVYVQR